MYTSYKYIHIHLPKKLDVDTEKSAPEIILIMLHQTLLISYLVPPSLPKAADPSLSLHLFLSSISLSMVAHINQCEW